MRNLRSWMLVSAVVGTAALACTSGDDSSELLGTWVASRVTVTNASNAAQTTELTALGAGLSITFNSNMTYTTVTTLSGQAADSSNGTWVQTSSSLSLTDSDTTSAVTVFSKSIKGNTLTLTGGLTTYDFGSGDVPAKFDVVATKQ